MNLDETKYSNNLMGYYLPSFFSIHLNTRSSLDNLNNLPNADLSTFVHEYVHFLQDITTTFGLTNIINNVNVQKAINAKVISVEAASFRIPVSFQEYTDTDAYANLNEMFLGDFNSKFNEFSEVTGVDIIENGMITDHEEKAYVRVTFRNFHQNHSFSFGALHLMENMAYLIEESMFDGVNPPVYPYKIVIRLLQFLYPNLSTNPALTVLICDYSLMSPDPGRFFFSLVTILEQEKASSFDHIYDILRKFTFHNNSGVETTIFGLYEERLQLALGSLKDYFTIELFKEIHEWFEAVFTDLGTYRMERFNFWYELLSEKTKKDRYSKFVELTNVGGFPLISNDVGQVVFSHSKVHPENLLVLSALYSVNNILFDRASSCHMINICKHGPEDITSKRCQNPWEQGSQLKLCPFGQIIKMWGIHNKFPKRADS